MLGAVFGYVGWALSVGLLLYIVKLKVESSKDKAIIKESEKRMSEQKAFFDQSQSQLEKVFKGLASDTLQTQSEAFLKLASERLDKKTVEASGTFTEKVLEFQKLLNPMKDTLSKLQVDMSKVEKERNEQFGRIAEQLSQVTLSNENLKKEASSLTSALKRPEVRGSWGEIQLRRVVELAGMNAFCDFDEQVSVKGGEGSVLRPDLVVRLPNERVVIVDSKAVWAAFMEATEATDAESKKRALEKHSKNLRSRVQDLSKKSYWGPFEHSADFAVLFIPTEAILSAAVEYDKLIIEDALKEKIIIATPTTLVALLKAIAYGWNQNQVTENAREMISQVKIFYERLSPWLKHFVKIGNQLDGAVKAFNDSSSSLNLRVLPSVRKLKELGLQSDDLPEASHIEAMAKHPEIETGE